MWEEQFGNSLGREQFGDNHGCPQVLQVLKYLLKSTMFAQLSRNQARTHFQKAIKEFAFKQAMNYQIKETAKDLNSRNQNELVENTVECAEFKDFRAFPRGWHFTVVGLVFTGPAHVLETDIAGARVPGHYFEDRCWRFWYKDSEPIYRREYDCETKKWIGERETL